MQIRICTKIGLFLVIVWKEISRRKEKKKVTRVSKTIPTKRYHDFPNIMNFDQHHDLKELSLIA